MAEAAAIEETEVLEIGDLDAEAFTELAIEQGWSDGMPLVPPTEASVARFVEACRGDNEPFSPISPRQVVPTMQSRSMISSGTYFEWSAPFCTCCR